MGTDSCRATLVAPQLDLLPGQARQLGQPWRRASSLEIEHENHRIIHAIRFGLLVGELDPLLVEKQQLTTRLGRNRLLQWLQGWVNSTAAVGSLRSPLRLHHICI